MTNFFYLGPSAALILLHPPLSSLLLGQSSAMIQVVGEGIELWTAKPSEDAFPSEAQPHDPGLLYAAAEVCSTTITGK